MKKISLAEVEFLAHQLAKETMSWNEPIPDFSSRFPNKLESCLASPFYTFARKNLYKGLLNKAAVLFYFLIKNHPFQNGNKRVAMSTLFLFLYKNKKWLRVDNQQLYNFARLIAQSDPIVKDEMVSAIKKFIKTYLVELK